MSEKWTPGPWWFEADEVEGMVYVAHKGTECPSTTICSFEAVDECDVANARLIAAAPDMYEALEAMLEFPNSGPSHSFAKTALKKARGE